MRVLLPAPFGPSRPYTPSLSVMETPRSGLLLPVALAQLLKFQLQTGHLPVRFAAQQAARLRPAAWFQVS